MRRTATLTIGTDEDVERAVAALAVHGRSRLEVARAAILDAERAQRRALVRAEAEMAGVDRALRAALALG